MVLLAKFLLLLFMIIVVHGNIVVDVEQKVNIDGCCNGCCPCNSCDPCWNNGIPLPENDPETCTIKYCENGKIKKIKICGNDTGCCLIPNTNEMVCPDTELDLGGCIVEVCRNTIWRPVKWKILGHCVKCKVWGEPHFRTFGGSKFSWQIPCNHALAQKGFTNFPSFGVFMDFYEVLHWKKIYISMVGPTIYKEGSIEVKLDPGSNIVWVQDGLLHRNVITSATFTELYSFRPTHIYARWKRNCISIYGNRQMLIKLCPWKITIWAPEFSNGGYPQLGGLCSTNNRQMKKLEDRNRVLHDPPPRSYDPCNDNFGFDWQTETWGNPGQTKSSCPMPSRRRKKRDAEDPQMVCSNVTNSPYNDKCLEIVQESGLTGPEADMFYETCMFDLCVVDGFVDPEILTKEQMIEGYMQITEEAINEEDNTIYCVQDETCRDAGGTCNLINDDYPECDPTLCSGEDCACCIITVAKKNGET